MNIIKLKNTQRSFISREQELLPRSGHGAPRGFGSGRLPAAPGALQTPGPRGCRGQGPPLPRQDPALAAGHLQVDMKPGGPRGSGLAGFVG